MSVESRPQGPPINFSPENPMYGTLSPQGQWVWTMGGWIANPDYQEQEQEQEEEEVVNPIVQVDLQATVNDRFYLKENPEEQYIGPYHRHEDGTLMIGLGVLGLSHDPIIDEEMIFEKFGYEDLQETREKVSDIFYKLWFQSNTLSDSELLSLQTTIRDGIKQTGRTEDEPLVFYKKDRNTLESRKDLQGDVFEKLCQYVYDNNITDFTDKFSIEQIEGPIVDNQDTIQYSLNFDNDRYKINIANKVGDSFTDILNLSQLTKPKTATRVNPEKAREVLDTNIFELLPNQTTRQDTINSFLNRFNELIGPRPAFEDVDGDGVGEVATNYEEDKKSRISYENQRNAFITRLDEQAEGDSNNQGKTLESMRNKLNTYLGDTDNVIDILNDARPEYENKSEGFLKIRKPNQAIILRSPNNDLLEFQKDDSYLVDGFTITMWVRFVSKTSEGTLFNFGNPLVDNGVGFRLDTKVNKYQGKDHRYIRLMLRDKQNNFYDNHFGALGLNRFQQRSYGGNANNVYGAYNFYDENGLETEEDTGNPRSYYPNIHEAFPRVEINRLDEWYFICATYNPNVYELGYNEQEGWMRQNKQYWLNHVNHNQQIVPFSGQGARCKVELISRSDLLNARGYIGRPLTVLSKLEDVLDSIQSSFTYVILNNQDNQGNNETTVELPSASFQYQIITT